MFQYIKVIRLLQQSSAIVNGGGWRYIVRDLETIIVLVLFAFDFFLQRSSNPIDSTDVTKIGQ